MKRIIALLLAAILCMYVTACSKETVPEENAQEIRIAVTNTVKESVAGLGATWYLGDQTFGSTGMQAVDGKEIGNSTVEFVLNREDIPQDADLDEFGVKFSVKEISGVEFHICTLHFPVEFGKKYVFELRNEGGCYVVWAESDGSIHSGSAIAKPGETTQQSIELVGSWHLDSEKNNLAAFSDRFPGYAEWGASMEIRSDGRMSWYIGAHGWHGTYVIDDETLHAELDSDLEQITLPWDFRIVTENETTMLEMDYEDMTVYWIYGDQEGVSVGNDNE